MVRSDLCLLLAFALVGCSNGSTAGKSAEPSSEPNDPSIESPQEDEASSEKVNLSEAVIVFEQFLSVCQNGDLGNPEGQRLLMDEAESWPDVGYEALEMKFDKILRIDGSNAVARVTSTNGERTRNLYFLLRKTPEWKIRSVRALSVGILEKTLEDYEKLNALMKERGSDDEEFSELGIKMAPLKRLLLTDQELIEWFRAHQSDLEKVVESAKTRGLSDPSVEKQCDDLQLNDVRFLDDGSLKIVLGGVLDNAVGFVFVDVKQPPVMSDSDYIWVEKIADGWYLFKTT